MLDQKAWKEAAAEVCRVNDMNGFDRPTWDNLLSKSMLVVTELDEACTATKDSIADPLNEELADTAVRLLHILESVWPLDWNMRGYIQRHMSVYHPIEILLWPIVHQICWAVEFWRKDKVHDTRICLEQALAKINELACRCGYDLFTEVIEKVAKNAKRGHLHGKKRSDG